MVALRERDPDVDAEISRYTGARRVDVADHPALLLPRLAARPASVVVWAPSAGELAWVTGSVVGDDDVVATAVRRGLGVYGTNRRPSATLLISTVRADPPAGTMPPQTSISRPVQRPLEYRPDDVGIRRHVFDPGT